MKFIDEARIFARSGDGGDGCASFRREKYIPKGGPDGGNGGNGGSVIFTASQNLSTLIDFKYRQHYVAKNGEPGRSRQQYGAAAEDLLIEVPVGTLIRNANSRELLADLNEAGQSFQAAKGGRGGRGNLEFVSSTNQTPLNAEEGEPGEELTLHLELKLLADIALVGFPNAGKSTLISSISAARPKIAEYPFTTLVPQLGVATVGEAKDRKSFVVADIPGIIEGAHTGKGLGLRFLKHLERTRLLWFVIDAGGMETATPDQAYEVLLRELEAYDQNYQQSLSQRPRIVVMNKNDLQADPENVLPLLARLKKDNTPAFSISALTKTGLQELLWATWEMLGKTR